MVMDIKRLDSINLDGSLINIKNHDEKLKILLGRSKKRKLFDV